MAKSSKFGGIPIRDAVHLRGADYRESGLKNTLDRTVAGLVLGGVALPMAAGIVASKLERGLLKKDEPIFFTQIRPGGKNKKGIPVIKIPTYAGWDRSKEGVTSVPDDPRVLKYTGKLLRKTALDETPQLFAVLRGNSAMVGPRPYLPEDIERMYAADADTAKEWDDTASAKAIKDGLTSRASALNHRFKQSSDGLWIAKMNLDIDYRDNASLRTDLAVLIETAGHLAASFVEPLPQFEGSHLDSSTRLHK